jgi:UDP-2-acetamido-3-amino-2,3-dideoxy-glucuronate N-acetyltransferase
MQPGKFEAIQRLAVLGYGYWGPNQVRSFCQLLGEERMVVCEPNPARQAVARERHPRVGIVAEIAQVLADASIGAVSLCTPAGQHAAQAHRFLESGRHVLVEKPLATTSVEGQALVDLAGRQGLTLMAGHIFLFHPAVRALRQLIVDGDLGEVRFITGIRSSLGPRVRDEVNVVWDYLIHDCYIVPYLVGHPPLAVRADGGSWLQPGIPDAVFARLDFGDGQLAHLQSSWYYPFKARRMVVVGSRRMAVWDEDAQDKLTLYERGYAPYEGVDRWGNRGLCLYDEGARPIPLETAEPLRLECEHFLACIVNGQQPVANGGNAAGTLRMLEAIDASLADGGARVGM